MTPIPNASTDPFAYEFDNIIEGNTISQSPYHRLSTKMTYKRVFYHHETKQYSVNEPKNPSPTVEKSSVPSAEGHIVIGP